MKRESHKKIKQIKELLVEIGLLERGQEDKIDRFWIDLYMLVEKKIKEKPSKTKSGEMKGEKTQ